MSNQAVLDRMKISRACGLLVRIRVTAADSTGQIISHSTNCMYPGNLRRGVILQFLAASELVHLEGELVEATGPEIGTWRSSLSRTDTGNGACELMLVDDCSKLSRAENRSTKLVRR